MTCTVVWLLLASSIVLEGGADLAARWFTAAAIALAVGATLTVPCRAAVRRATRIVRTLWQRRSRIRHDH